LSCLGELKRFQQSGQSHFVTFSYHHRSALFMQPSAKDVFEAAIEQIRRDYELRVYGYVTGLSGPPARADWYYRRNLPE
jgi:hypothetical protein